MHHMKVYKWRKERAKAERNGYHKPEPFTAEEQARIAEAINRILATRKNVQLQLV